MISKTALGLIQEVIQNNELSMYRGTPDGNDGGIHVQRLEEAFKEYFQVKHAVAMNSATSCLHAACLASDVKSKEVYVSPFSFSSSASCVLMAGGTPIFTDIEPTHFGIRVRSSEHKYNLTWKNLCIAPHLFGNYAGCYNEESINDAAQSLGTYSQTQDDTTHNIYKLGGKGMGGRCTIFSFNNSKTISCGEGGMLVTDDDEFADKCRAIRNHAEASYPDFKMVGFNYRLGEVEAIIAYDQFLHLDEINNHRIELCEYVTSQLKEIEGLVTPWITNDTHHVYWLYPLKVDKKKLKMNRMEFASRLRSKGIQVNEGYNKPLHLLPIYEQFGYKLGDFPVVERMYFEELLVFSQFKPPMTLKECKVIVNKIKECVCRE